MCANRMRFAMYSTTNTLTTTLRAALFASFLAGSSAWAGETTLAHNEHAAQNTIVETAESRPVFNEESAPTLAHNEDAAQHAVVDTGTSIPARAGIAIDGVPRAHNDMAAHRAIGDA